MCVCVCVCVCFGESGVDIRFNSEANKLQQALHVSEMSAFTLCVCVSFGGSGVDRHFISDANKMRQALRVSETSTFTLCVCVCVLGRVGLIDTLKVKLKKCSEHCMFQS